MSWLLRIKLENRIRNTDSLECSRTNSINLDIKHKYNNASKKNCILDMKQSIRWKLINGLGSVRRNRTIQPRRHIEEHLPFKGLKYKNYKIKAECNTPGSGWINR